MIIKQQKGFSLIEILVSLVVISVGLLGLAGLQLKTTKATHSAEFRTKATILSYSIIDSMRANRQSALDGDYDFSLSSSPLTGGDLTVAEDDIAQWMRVLERELPAADGEIARNNDVITVRVKWDDSRGQGAAKIFEYMTVL